MDGLDGRQFVARLRAAGVDCKVVLLTAWGEFRPNSRSPATT